MRQFYIDLADWIESVNAKSQLLSPEKYWEFIFNTSNQLKEKYNNHMLVSSVVSTHINYLVSMSDDLPF